MKKVNFFLFDDFETLDLFGVVEIFGRLEELFSLEYYSLNGGVITSKQKTGIITHPICELKKADILIIPSEQGTRRLVNDAKWLAELTRQCQQATSVLTICTGSALLAQTHLLDGLNATSNKLAFDWVCTLNHKVNWEKKARWVVAGKFYTSSGVSAGIDMALGFISDKYGRTISEKIAHDIEYIWNSNKDQDPFCIQ